MRTLSIWMLAAAVLASFSRAPSEHFHLDDPGHHHAHHGEWNDADPLAWELPDHDADAIYKDWVAHAGSLVFPLIALCPSKGWSFASSPDPGTVGTLVTRNHDPPGLAQLPARAPPVSLLPQRSS